MKKSYKAIKVFMLLLVLAASEMGAQALSGAYTINSGQSTGGTNFASFTAFANAINTNGVSGPVTVNVQANSGPYNEQPAFNQITGASASNPIVINGNGNTLTFNANSSTPYTMLLNGTDYLSVNNLFMSGTNSNYAMVLVLMNTANYNNFSACSFSCQQNGTSSYQVPICWSSSYQYPSSGGNPGNFNAFTTCTVASGYYAIFHYGAYNAPYTTDNSFTKCYITDFYQYAVYAPYAKNLSFTGCTFDQLTRNNLNYVYFLEGDYMQGFMFDGNTIHKLFNASQSSTGQLYGFMYINYNPSGQTNRNIVRNNIIKDIAFQGGIYLFYYCYYGDIDWIHNTISLDHAGCTTSQQTYVWYYCYNGSPYSQTWTNNLITVTRGGSGQKMIWYFGGNVQNSTINYNNPYCNSAGGGNNIGYFSSTATTFAQWQSQGVDVNGYNLNPNYVNLGTGDLHPTNTSLNNKATPLGVLYDQQNAIRNQSTPDIGALEFLTPLCNYTPTNSIAGPNPICPNGNATLTINNLTSDLGITYQWQSSTVSPVGPWNTVPSATVPMLAVQNLTQSTYYSVIITCTAPGGGASTPVHTLNIAGTTINNIPYYEGFEGIQGPNKLPNCSWTSPQIGGTAFTYTSAGSNYRMPHAGSKFASFSSASPGVSYFYTNGLNLNAGITYSAALWFLTEQLYGYANWTDLSIMIGTSQTSAGLTSIASTGNAAIATQYKLLDNTFTVPATGVYYLAIRATGSAGSALYLSWDDLSVTVPCNISANSPNVGASANNISICSGATVNLTASGADTYVWSNGATSTVIADAPQNNGSSPMVVQYKVVGTSAASGCTNSATQNITVKPSPVISVTGVPALSCAGKPISMIAQSSSASSFTWNTGANGNNLTASPTANTSYTVLGSNSYNCVGSSQYLAAVKPLPTVQATPAQVTICEKESVTMTASGAQGYMWASQNLNLQSNPMLYTGMTQGLYQFTVTGTDNFGCQNTAMVTVNVDACLGLSKLGSDAKNIRVFPNPTTGELNVELSNGTISSIQVTDLTGRVIVSEQASDVKASINVANLAAGVYYVKVASEGSVDVIKVIKN